jgi:hypothetical protein
MKGCKNMMWTIFVILLALGALGMVASYSKGALVHVLLVLALVVITIDLMRGNRSIV